MKEFTSGARSSEEAPRLDLIPVASLIRQAARMAEGAKSHGERNFEKGARDPVFIRDRKNHLLAHALAYVNGDESDDHLGAILANAGMLARLEQINAVPEVALTADDVAMFEAAKEWVETREPTVTVGAPFVQVIEWPQTASVTTTSPGLQDGSHWHYKPATDRSQMTYDERRAELHQCRCGRMVHSDTACDRAGKCLAGLHPHAVPAVPAE